MSDQIKIRKADGIWVVRAGGAVIAESRAALELTGGPLEPVIFFPRDDVAMAFLEPSAHRSETAGIGTASYFSVIARSATLENAAWSYEDPEADADRIRNHLAFQDDQIAVEQL